jgi:hypothetical protein
MTMLTSLLMSVLVGVLMGGAAGFGVSIEAHEEICFIEHATAGTKLSLTFQVAEGGFLDIDVSVCTRVCLLFRMEAKSYW